ncbi:uncharacterized protein EAF01_003218 [Botrytis porri]|uniref:C2H2-type domain-containing protein n=1 Tax=Botrytis porri TaxID=87229 RepID=A0A4Z1KKG9_9HELO|nr:uncharacterized protein EAF01_003218 [Botrytis porri]KAF7909500.1 hypothetical protein EAF01_003218 [Botrytis porri]TGO84752.1 hypothetical protein BPOR_0469g00030 [Botrytis porri]
MDSQETPPRWPCPFQGCTKSFQRKEHLTRHQKSHSNSSPAHICRICHKKFSRSDGLQRHLGRHGQQFKKHTGRSRRACASCHSSKIKCDGNNPCSRCEKKNISCKYGLPKELPTIARRQDEASRGDVSDWEGSEFSMSENVREDQMPAESPKSGQTPSPDEAFVTNQISIVAQAFNSGQSSRSNQSFNSISTHGSLQEAHDSLVSRNLLSNSITGQDSPSMNLGRTPHGLLDWSNVRIQQDASQTREAPQDTFVPTSKLEYLCSLAKETVERYCSLYFANFHDRWPIVHSPTYEDDEEAPEILLPSMLMIGGWIDGTPSSRDWALKVHHHVVEHVIPRLCQLKDIDTMTQPLPIVLYQCTLLNIIFASYCGKREVLKRGLILRNLLVASIYQAGILTPGTIYPDDKPGYFLPLRSVRDQQRKRIVVGLFKIDTYFSAITMQPVLLKPEELHFCIPDTIALWNAGGLPHWEARRLAEPKSRSYRSINVMFEEVALGGIEFPENESMLEDIQICLWAMQSEILHLSKQSRPERRNELSLNIQRQSLKRQLEALKRGFSNLSAKISCPDTFDQAEQSPVRYYYGLEDHDNPGWQDIVCRRIHNFIFDTSILHHLMNLQVFAEIQTLRMLAKDLALSDTVRGVFGGIYSQPHTRRVAAAREWTQEPSSRRALWHATEILLSHSAFNQTPSLANFIPDPISYIALASAALVIWTHCIYGQLACNALSCTSMLPHEVSMSIELTKLSEVINGSSFDEKGKEVWIEGGAYFRASIENIQLCSCNVGILMGKLRAHIPHHWEIVDEIAPNIFGKLGGPEATGVTS